MDAQRRTRKAARQAHTRAVNSLDEAVSKEQPKKEIRRLVDILKCRIQDLTLELLMSHFRLICNFDF